MRTVEVDFNNLTKDGRVRASQRRADGPVSSGDVVSAIDSAEDMRFEATVVEVRPDGRLVLDVHWEPVVPAFRLTHNHIRPNRWTVSRR